MSCKQFICRWLCMACFCLPFSGKANHIVGADITWKYLGSDTFEITAAVYRNCESFSLSNTPFSYFGDCTAYTAAKTIYGSMCCTRDVTPNAAYYGCTRCSDPKCGYAFGYQQVLITAKIVFPKGCCNWYVSWEQNSRDGAITTGAAGKKFYVEAELNTCLKSADNSPQFAGTPQNIFCKGNCQTMDYKAADPESDSLVFSLVNPLSAHNSAIAYSTGYSAARPLNNVNNDTGCSFRFDTETGALTADPAKLGTSVLAEKVEEYRKDASGNWQRIGFIMRDVELYVTNACVSFHAPVIREMNGGSTYKAMICTGQSVCLGFSALDQDAGDSVKLEYDSSDLAKLKGATITILNKNTRWPSMQFCWQPDTSYSKGNNTYLVKITVTDNSTARLSNTYYINPIVVPLPAAAYSGTDQGCGKILFIAADSATTNYPIKYFSWTVIGPGNVSGPGYGTKASVQCSKPGKYYYDLTVNNVSCGRTYHDSINVTMPLCIYPSDTIVCAKSPAIILKPSALAGKPPFSFKWNTGDTIEKKSAIISKDTLFVIDFKDSTGCNYLDTIHIKYKIPSPPGPLKTIYGCAKDGAVLSSSVSSSITWTKIAGKTITYNFSKDNPLVVKDSGIYVATAQNSNICPGADSFSVAILPPIPASWLKIDTDVCAQDSFNLNLRGVAYQDKIWQVQGSTLVLASDIGKVTYYRPMASDTLIFKWIRTVTRFGVTCMDTAIETVYVHITKHPKLLPIGTHCYKETSINLEAYENPAFKGGYWYCATNPKIVNNNIVDPSKIIVTKYSKTVYLHYVFENIYKCTTDDSVPMTVWRQVYAGPDITVHAWCGPYLLSLNHPVPSNGKWMFTGNTPTEWLKVHGDSEWIVPPANKPADTSFEMRYVVNDSSTGCVGSQTVEVSLDYNHSSIKAVRFDTLCPYPDQYLLSVTPTGGVWSVADKTPPSAIGKVDNGSVFITSVAGPGLHHLVYTLAPGQCPDTFNTYLYVASAKSLKYFQTNPKSNTYCANETVELIAPDTNGIFKGIGVYKKGNKWYADLSKCKSDLDTITFILQNDSFRCPVVQIEYLGINRPASISLTGDRLVCSRNGSFHLIAHIHNSFHVIWTSETNGQDGGSFSNPLVADDSIYNIYYIPTDEQLKKKSFPVTITAYNTSCGPVSVTYTCYIKPGPQPDFISQREGCDPFYVKFKNLSADSGGTITNYTWDFGDSTALGFNANPSHTYRSGNDSIRFYTVQLTVDDNQGCNNTITKKGWIIADASPQPHIKAFPNLTTLDKPEVQFDIDANCRFCGLNDSAAKYAWHFIDSFVSPHDGFSNLKAPRYKYSDTGYYTVALKVINAAGCTGTDSEINLVHILPAFVVYVPNAFLPGRKKDGSFYFNKIFKPVLVSCATYNMTIYNRWGELVFETSDPAKGWDGTYLGQPCPEGVYLYTIKATDITGTPHKISRTVMLLK